MSELVNNPHQPCAARLRTFTPARVGLGRTGVSLETTELLDFQRAHAQARDAVHARLDCVQFAAVLQSVSGGEVLCLRSQAADRATYLQRPDLGRKLDDASRNLLVQHAGGGKLAVIVADGLSALAVERHAHLLVERMLPLFGAFTVAPVCIVDQGRVAIGDEIGFALGADIAVLLIGERPGLSSPDSLGAYITWQPRPGRTDAERNCISNIRPEGLSIEKAAGQILQIVTEASRLKLTGVALKTNTPLIGEG
jgi:Ethanolamine ammonia-lyase, small subunit